jgi:signal transduction histidine kinase
MLHVSLSDSLPLVRTSPDMLTEALRVVVKNAAEAVSERHDEDEDGHIWVVSSVVDGSDERAFIEVSVRDNGTGIRPENQSKLFEIRWSTKGGRGMGFGLFWTKDYVDGLGGSIRADSVWGEGTTFSIRLPWHTVPTAVQ